MLVQRRKSSRKTVILWGGVIILVALAVLLVYQNISTEVTPAEESARTAIERLPVPKNFGTDVFEDPRFNELSNNGQVEEYINPYVTSFEATALSAGTIPAPAHISVNNPGHGGSLAISWSPVTVPGLTGYTIWRQEGGTLTEYVAVPANQTSFVDYYVVNGQEYSYYVTALKQILTESAPIVTAESIGSGGIRLTFSYPEEAEAVQLYRMREGNEELLTTLKLGQDQYIDRNGELSDDYYARAFQEYIESTPSAFVRGTPEDVVAPDSPSDIKVASSKDGLNIVISWTNPLDEDLAFIRIYRSEVQGVLGNIIKNAPSDMTLVDESCTKQTQIDSTLQNAPESNCFLDTDVFEGTTYYYVVTSVDIHGNESSRKIVRTIGNDDPFSI